MREDRTLRGSLLIFATMFLIIPLVTVSAFMQFRIWNLFNEGMQSDIEEDLLSASQTMDLVMDKYDSVLYDFCTDDEILELVEHVNDQEDELDINRNRLRKKLSHICNRHEGIEAVTLVTKSGTTLFYDRTAASSIATVWADSVEIPVVTKGPVYQEGITISDDNDGYIHLFQIARRLINYQNIYKEIGTVILSINQDILWESIPEKKNSSYYVCNGNRVVAAKMKTHIHETLDSLMNDRENYLSVTNATTGWMVYDFYSTYGYNQALTSRMAFDLLSTVVSVLFVFILLMIVTQPTLKQVNRLNEAMTKVEWGDFSVKVEKIPNLPQDIAQIVDGFNTMVQKIGVLMEQVKQSMLEQKNAELSAMEAQIDPHFLYNTLDTINWKAIELEEYGISSMVGALADILRYSIRNPGETVSIGQELYWLNQYVMLQKEKLEQPLKIITDVPQELLGYRIHKLILQPFIENAIKHAFYHYEGTCCLEVSMKLSGSQIHIIVKDNGKGMPKESLRKFNDEKSDLKGHVGIANVRKRLKLYYGDDAAIYFESQMGVGTAVHIFVKAIHGEEDNDKNHNC